jgi:hypothetical protein
VGGLGPLDRFQWDRLVERYKTTPVRHGKREQVRISDLPWAVKPLRVDGATVEQAN